MLSPTSSRLTLADVARGASMSVQNLRKVYINKGRLTVCHDSLDKPYVELIECVRVFPGFQVPSKDKPVADNPVASGYHQLQQQLSAQDREIAGLHQRLSDEAHQRQQAEERETWLRQHLDRLAQENLLLLSAPAKTAVKPSWFARLFS